MENSDCDPATCDGPDSDRILGNDIVKVSCAEKTQPWLNYTLL